jgi:putative DNA primase/helicase
MAVARQFMDEHHVRDGAYVLRNHRGDFYEWRTTHWAAVGQSDVTAWLYTWLEHAYWIRMTASRAVEEPFQPNRSKIANVVAALQAITHVEDELDPPGWLARSLLPATDIVSVENGLLHVPSRSLSPHTPGFFNHHALAFSYLPNAPEPKRWMQFVHELWGDDRESIDTLHEIMGYILAGGTGQHKIFMTVGPTRSGKGTIQRVLTGLLGAHNVAAPTLSGLATNFGLSPLIGKPLAAISDARLGNRADNLIAVERLLSVSGEDVITIDRKYKEPWTGKLPTRFMLLTNEVPHFSDASGALASRFIVLTLTESFYGREDLTLTESLLDESAGIFNLAMEGLDRLNERGHFVMPQSSQDALRHLQDLASPISAFLRDRAEVAPGKQTGKDTLYNAYKGWADDQGLKASTKPIFLRDLKAAVPSLKPRRIDREHVVEGISLRESP